MESILTKAILSVQQSEIAFSKFITANDAGATGAHQAGFHIHKNSWQLFFDAPGEKGTNKDKFITIRWQDNFETTSRFIYYGVGTRNEYRLTRFGRGFPYLEDENIGDLLIICKRTPDYYNAFVLDSDDEIEEFFASMNISPTDTNGIIPRQFQPTAKDQLLECFNAFVRGLAVDFPTTVELATRSRNCYKNAYDITAETIRAHADREILQWLDAEFQLFKIIENIRYNQRIQTPFATVEELVECANTILNRRKSRAGKSLEHHLAEVFNTCELSFVTQAITEDNKKPDFLFPDVESYRNPTFNTRKLVMLASKTTCKDRWRQILNEADRIKTKHLFTLQQGISQNQLEEMYKYNVCLVVPQPYITSFPKEYRDKILTLDNFLEHISHLQQ
jgi:hypothetical protein